MTRTASAKFQVLLVGLLVVVLTMWGFSPAARGTTNDYVVTELLNAPILMDSVIDYHGVTYTNGRDRTTGVDHMYVFDGTSFTEVPGTYGMIDPTIFNDKLVFLGYTASGYNAHVYEFDGVTVRDMSIDVGMLGSLDMLAIFNGFLYIGNNNSATNYETYKYSGSGSPVRVSSLPIGIETPVVFGGKLYVRGWHAPGTYDLYSIDTTDTVTQLTTDISPSMLTVANNKLYYFGYVNYPTSFTRQFYSFDGTTTVAEATGGTTGASPISYNGAVYYAPMVNSTLMRIAPSQIDNVTLSSTDGALGRPTQLITFDGRLFFRSTPMSGFTESLWWTDFSTTNLIPGLNYNIKLAGVGQNELLVYTYFNYPNSARLFAIARPQAATPSSSTPPTDNSTSTPTLAATGFNISTFAWLSILLLTLGIFASSTKRRREKLRGLV